MKKFVRGMVLVCLVLAACDRKAKEDTAAPATNSPPPPAALVVQQPVIKTLLDARKGFATKLTKQLRDGSAVPTPPAGVFNLVHYQAPTGKMAAYLSPDPGDGKKHPAIIWIFGGFDNGISETAWEQADPDNDQSASAFRKAGILMMYPSLRGGNDNPGYQERFFGEVDDVLAAADLLAKQSYVDPARIYLGGHSTGGTLALLVAESTNRFRSTFSFGPVSDVTSYGMDKLVCNWVAPGEIKLRSPGNWLHLVRTPVYVFEGTGNPSNIQPLQLMAANNPLPSLLHFYEVHKANHFSTLAPLTKLIATKIIADNGAAASIDFKQAEIDRPFVR